MSHLSARFLSLATLFAASYLTNGVNAQSIVCAPDFCFALFLRSANTVLLNSAM